MEFLAPIFTKIFRTEHQYVEIFYTKSHTNLSRNEESKDRNLYNPFRTFMTNTEPFSQPPAQFCFAKNSYAEFHEKTTDYLLFYTGHKRTEGRTSGRSLKKYYIYVVQNGLKSFMGEIIFLSISTLHSGLLHVGIGCEESVYYYKESPVLERDVS